MSKKVEILAPAGNFDCLVAAIKSGADAIYVGGDKFGARANANNFNLEELKQAIDLVHLHDKQIYLAVNTLLKEQELEMELYSYLFPLYEHGIDAVIVQDLGVLQYIKTHFPDLPIHASTQMTVTGILGAKFLENLGVERIVTSRELSFEEVSAISRNTNIEIESFVHGALCYSFSGQCLYSSMIGGRSGNRGQCAQPCRLPYRVNKKIDYFMSLKDICTLHDIPSLVEAGVYSFKIEGRMKKPEYVASVTAMYRKYVDLYLKVGPQNYQVLEEDIDMLKDIFNRGDFHSGYWKQHNGQDMITEGRPNHTGVPVVKVIDRNARITRAKVLKKLQQGDILEITNNGDNYTLGKSYEVGEVVELSLRKSVVLYKDQLLYRTRNQWLIEEIHHQLDRNKLQKKIEATIVLMVGAPAILNLQIDDIYLSIEGEMIHQAEKQPTTQDKILKQLNKTGNASFIFQNIEIVMDENIFIPVQQLNQLRREGLEALALKIVSKYRRTVAPENTDKKRTNDSLNKNDKQLEITVYVETIEQFQMVVSDYAFTKIYMDCNIMEKIWVNPKFEEFVNLAHRNHKKIYLVMPHIFRDNMFRIYEKHFQHLIDCQLNGIMVRNLESFAFLKQHNYLGEILLDHHIYMFNNSAIDFWEGEGVALTTNSLELTATELKELDQTNMELVIYGYTPNMISAQCIHKTTGNCKKQTEIIKIKDRINKEIHIKNCCDYCYNIIYNTCPISLFDEYIEINTLGSKSLRVAFTVEKKSEIIHVVDALHDFINQKKNTLTTIETTKGHFRRGIK